MKHPEVSRSHDQITESVALELDLKPTDSIYRHLHPVMVCGIQDDKLLLKGIRTNGTSVEDNYQLQPTKVRASSLPEPGLNFTRNFNHNYKNHKRRLAVSIKMADQPQGLRLYPDFGSEVPSVYLTLPEDSFFKVDFKEGDLLDIGIAIKIHHLMKNLPLKEEPEYLDWMDSDEGVRVTSYFRQENGKNQMTEISFIKEGKSYRINIPLELLDFLTMEEKKILEIVSIYRLLIDNKDFVDIIGLDNTRYKKEDLTNSVTDSPEFKTMVSTNKLE